MVKNSSIVNFITPIVLFKCLICPTPLSHSPSKFGERGGRNFQITCSDDRKFDTAVLVLFIDFNNLFNSADTPRKLDALSHETVLLLPLRAEKSF